MIFKIDVEGLMATGYGIGNCVCLEKLKASSKAIHAWSGMLSPKTRLMYSRVKRLRPTQPSQGF